MAREKVSDIYSVLCMQDVAQEIKIRCQMLTKRFTSRYIALLQRDKHQQIILQI